MRFAFFGRGRRSALLAVAAVLAGLASALSSPASCQSLAATQEGSLLPPTVVAPFPPPTTQQWSLAAGGFAWSGDYGAMSKTTIDALLLSTRYKIGDLRLTATVPNMRIDSRGLVLTGVDGSPLVISPQSTGPRTIRGGWGDLTLGAAYLLTSERSRFGADLDFSFKLKVPTASDASRLSTGQKDYAFNVEASRPLGRLVPFASVGYRVFGDLPTLRLKDGFAGSLGADYIYSSRLVARLAYDYAASASPFVRDSHEIVASFSSRLTQSRLRLTGFAGAGLSSGAASISGGLSLAVGF